MCVSRALDNAVDSPISKRAVGWCSYKIVIVGLRVRVLERFGFGLCACRLRLKRLIPHLSACCAFGLDGEAAGRGAVSQAPGFLKSAAAQAKRPYTVSPAGLSAFGDACLTD